MSARLARPLLVTGLLALLFACSSERETDSLLRHVPAQTPYAFVVDRRLPEGLRQRMADYYAAQLAAQRPLFTRMRTQVEQQPGHDDMALRARVMFDVLDALFAEFEGRDTAAALSELGFEPVTRSLLFGIGPLPALRVEILDAERFGAMLDRIEHRAGVRAQRGELDGQSYRRIDLGAVDLVLAVTPQHMVSGLLVDARFDADLPLLLGHRLPSDSLADNGDMARLVERHGLSGYGEGFVRIDELLAIALGRGSEDSRAVMQALGGDPLSVSAGCGRLLQSTVAAMPRLAIGVSAADDEHMAMRAILESTPAVASRLQKLAAPVPGLGSAYDGLFAFGVGLNLPQLRNAIDGLLRHIAAEGTECEWVDPERLQAITPQLNIALGPMTAGIKGFTLRVEDLALDPQTLSVADVSAGMIAAVDDPRGIFALGAMFNPALAALQVPDDGRFVDLPQAPMLADQAPPMRVAIRDRALLLLAGGASDKLADGLLAAVDVATQPAPLLAVDYGVQQLVQRLGDVFDQTVERLEAEGESELAVEMRDQFASFRLQARLFERLRLALHANEQGLVMEQAMRLK
ncbi:MAG: hypothetical protein KDI82_04410 [Gammaproteobacteria bacterium]|nr:hypothetical protein [Gammaproteobacteria bacterium]